MYGNPDTGETPVSSPEAEAKAKSKPKKIKELFTPSPETDHEPRGPVGKPISEATRVRRANLLPARKDEDKPARTTRSGKQY